MRWIVMGVAALTILVFSLVATPAPPIATPSPPPSKCTQMGTAQADTMAGTDRKDVLCALQGNDFLSGADARDKLFGDTGRDAIVGGRGPDILKGLKGRDRLFAVDGKPNDLVNGNKGDDFCFADPGDTLKNCEHRFRHPNTRMMIALSDVFQEQGELAELLIEAGVSPPPAPVTVTETVVIDPCAPGPPQPPPFCGGG